MPLTWRDRAPALALSGLAAVLIGGIVHLASVLAIPRWAADDAYSRVKNLGGKPGQTVAGPPATGHLFPYRDPALATAFCLYDLSVAPLDIHLSVAGADFLTVSLHGRHGQAFYALTNRSASGGAVALTLMTQAQSDAAADANDTTDPAKALNVVAPEPKGFVEVQALATAPSQAGAAQAAAGQLACKPGKSAS